MEKIKCSEKVTNEQILEHIGENITPLSNVLRRKAKWVGLVLRRNCFLRVIEGHCELNEVGGKRRQLLDDLRKKKILGAKRGN